MPLDHVGINVSKDKYDAVVKFYTLALEPLGYTKRHDIPDVVCGFGTSEQEPEFWIAKADDTGVGFHAAFSAKDHEAVQKFHAAALKAGGVDNGGPGLRTNYHKNYYAAFITDPLG